MANNKRKQRRRAQGLEVGLIPNLEVVPGLGGGSKKLCIQVGTAQGGAAPLLSLCFQFKAPLTYPYSVWRPLWDEGELLKVFLTCFSSSNVLDSH